MVNGLRRLFPWAVGIVVAALLVLNVFGIDQVRAMIGGAGFAVSPTGQYDNLARGKPYTLEPKPNYPGTAEPDNAGKQLTDGVYSPEKRFWGLKSTLGWDDNRLITVTIDLGKVEPIRGVSYNTVAGGRSTRWPLAVYVLVSDDGANYYFAGELVAMSGEKRTPPAPTDDIAVHRFWTDELKTHGRYVQLIIDTDGNCAFTDEVEVYRGDAAWTADPHSGKPTAGGAEYIKAWATDHGVRARLRLDIQEARAAVAAAGLNVQATDALLRELQDLEAQIDQLAHIEPDRFRAVMPLNSLQARIFAVSGKLRQLQGSPGLQAWVGNPYDYLSPTQGPDKNALDRIDVWLMRGEWRYAVVNLTNSTAAAVSARLRIEGLPGGVNPAFIRVYQVEWTATREHKPIAAALSEARRDRDGYVVDVPAGMVRQVWLSFRPQTITPGNYAGRVAVVPAGGPAVTVPLGLQLFPLTFPRTPTLHLGGWDHTDGSYYFGVTDKTRTPLAAHLQERFVDTTWGDPEVLELGAFDPTGAMKPPATKRFDGWVARWPNARRYCINLESKEFFAGEKMGTPQFNAKVKSWLDFWVKHAGTKGIKPEQLILCPVDEPRDNNQDKIILAWVKAIRAAQPRVQIWENPIYKYPGDGLPEMYASADILSPPQDLLRKREIAAFYRAQQPAVKRLEIYSGAGPLHKVDPYSSIRLQAWLAWELGAEATSFWSFGDRGGKSGGPWQPYIALRPNCAPVFLDDDTVTPAKHMEAMRESVEDFEYFVMLRKALERAGDNHPAAARAKELLLAGSSRVLSAAGADNPGWAEPKDRWEADNVRLEILKTLAQLQ